MLREVSHSYTLALIYQAIVETSVNLSVNMGVGQCSRGIYKTCAPRQSHRTNDGLLINAV